MSAASAISKSLVLTALSAAALSLWGCAVFIRNQEVPPYPKGLPPSISRQDAMTDIDTLVRALESVHPDIYFKRSRESFAAQRQALIANLPDSMTRSDWYLRVAPLIAGFGDGHTTVQEPTIFAIANMVAGVPAASDYQNRIRYFPLRGTLDSHRHFIVTETVPGIGIVRGDRLVQINGHDVDDLIHDWIQESSGDSESARASSAAKALWINLPLHSIFAPYDVRYIDGSGMERSVNLEGRPLPSAGNTQASSLPAPNFTYQSLDAGIGYMNFYSMSDGLGRFKKDVRAMFHKLKADAVQVLIVDIRKNGGGETALGEELLRYMTHKPFRTWSSSQWKRSREARDFGKNYVRPPLGWLPWQYLFADGRRMYTGDAGTFSPAQENPIRNPEPAEPFFTGRVCVLTGADTFSAAVLLADAVKTYHLATIVGEETGGHPNLFDGIYYTFRLPRSGFMVSIPTERQIRANGNASDRSGVIPDIEVQTTAADIRAGTDPVLQRARDCPVLEEK